MTGNLFGSAWIVDSASQLDREKAANGEVRDLQATTSLCSRLS